MGTIEELIGKPLDEMSDEELMLFVRSSRAKRTALIEDSFQPSKKTKKEKSIKVGSDLLALLDQLEMGEEGLEMEEEGR